MSTKRVSYDRRLSGGQQVLKAFEKEGITPDIVLSAIDGDVLKAYVAAGLGIAIIQNLAFDKERDDNIEAIDPGNLFEPTIAYVTVKEGSFLRGFTRDFLKLLAPDLSMHSTG